MKICCYCSNNFEDEDCRPYGVDYKDACFTCAMKPENKDLTHKMVQEAIDYALSIGDGQIYIGHHSGPMPLPRANDEGNN